jgi:hypothetical protein
MHGRMEFLDLSARTGGGYDRSTTARGRACFDAWSCSPGVAGRADRRLVGLSEQPSRVSGPAAGMFGAAVCRRGRESFRVRQDGSTWYSLEYGTTSARMASLSMSG